VNFRFKIALWFSLSLVGLISVLLFTAHAHLDEELRQDRWDRSHPEYPQWVIHGSYTNEEVSDILSELLYVWLRVGIPLCLLSVVLGYFIALRSVRPVRKINRELSQLEAGSLKEGVTVTEHDPELAQLTRHINDLLRRVGDSYNQMADFSAQVAHELRTPLTLLRMKVESIASELPPEFSEEVQEAIRSLSQLVERSLLAAKAEGGRLEIQLTTVDLSTLLEELEDAYTPLAGEREMTLKVKIPPGQMVKGDAAILRQILHNLFGNAVRYASGNIRIRLRPQTKSDRLLLTITNRVATPLPSGGTGMGLRLVNALCIASPETQFRIKHWGNIFSARLELCKVT
jgi:signal transduction histidine kinase